MTTLREVQQELADLLGTIENLNAYPGAVDNVVPDAVMIAPHNPFADYTREMRMKSVHWTLKATILVPWNEPLNSQYDLNEYLDVQGERSIPRTIYNARRDLSFVVWCDQATDYGARYEVGGSEYLGAVIRIQVEA